MRNVQRIILLVLLPLPLVTPLRAAEYAVGADLSFLKLAEDHGKGFKDMGDRKSTRLNSSHLGISYAVFCLKKTNQYSGQHSRLCEIRGHSSRTQPSWFV